ncbi:hypothetical protein AN191_07755 [Loktanella sp. 5RATIMAR09]|uniref:hypothetical protein n=1 Tax=Loktanella sp. 5RATIMAR09 TaxID=1225655 RepID=UPI0006EBC7B4|nr:hypothetical protein [Loktanella sp. 5RATIMAR09]KQI72041.1 hypothetical protein AN191_07755 [Loktanella sp. 5RATIMAR09]
MFELHWTEYVKALGPTLIALFVAYVAFQQWKVNQATLRERLFERRMAVFAQTQTLLSSILRSAKCDDDALANFHSAPQVARFLFEKDLANYLEKIRRSALAMRLAQTKYDGLPVGEERSKHVDAEHKELAWLTEQLDCIFVHFQPYLGFSNHK